MVTRRSLRFANRVGNQRSSAMFASTRGPSRKPGLRGDDEERGLGEEGHDDEAAARRVAPARGHLLEEDGVQRLALGSIWTL